MLNERYDLQDDSLVYALKLVLNSTYNTSNHLRNLITNSNVNDHMQDTELLKDSIRQSDSSRRRVYCDYINGDLSTHSIYINKHNIYEPYRTAFTRFRVSSHNLACETGRWNRRGRGILPMEERLCSCGLIQTEEHVISFFPVSQSLRDNYNFVDINDLFSGNFQSDTVCRIIFEILDLYA